MAVLSDVLRKAIKDSDDSVYRIALETEIVNSQLYRFVNGDGLSLSHVDTLVKHLGYELVKKRGK